MYVIDVSLDNTFSHSMSLNVSANLLSILTLISAFLLVGCASAPLSGVGGNTMVSLVSHNGLAYEQAPAGAIDKPDLRIGDRWVYKQTEIVIGTKTPLVSVYSQTVTKVNGDRIELRQIATDKTGRIEQGSAKIRRFNRATMEIESLLKLDGEVKPLEFPLQLGNQWRYAYQTNQPTVGTTSYTFAAVVKGLVNVASGEPVSLLVEHQGAWKRQGLERNKPKLIEGTAVQRYWYSPDVGNFVKTQLIRYKADNSIESELTTELIRADVGALRL